jgi:amidase
VPADPDLLFRPATELALLVRAGDVSARELVEAALARIEALQPEINAFTLVDADGALAAADAIGPGDERPFAGVPIGIKDLTVMTAGLRLSNGSDLYDDFVPDLDSNVVRRLRAAGFVIVGKLNTPEMGIVPTTEPRRFGPSRNPWDRTRTTGGSSGGSAAAVAAGMLPIAHGSDGGGSIRIPAACCGLVGLKPSRGRISRAPTQGDSYLSTDGVLSRTVADTAALLDLLAGYEPGDTSWAPPPFEPFSATAAREPGILRIALALEPPLDAPLDPAAERAARHTAALLEGFGHRVEEVAPPQRYDDAFDTFTDVWAAQVALGVRFGEMIRGRAATAEDVEPLTWALHERALGTSSADYLRALTTMQSIGRRAVEWSSQWDVVLTPALAQRPLPLGSIDTTAPDAMATFRESGNFTPYTPFVNVTGQPAIALPMYQGDDGLPLAIQLVGPPLGEGLLLSLASQLEAEQRWYDRRPTDL